MALRKLSTPSSVPDSPEKLLYDLPRRKIKGLLVHQGEMLKAYNQNFKLPDVALQLPTGSGKTLVGLLIAEWRRRKFKERVLYLCPTNQLVNQVAEQASDQYGLNVNGFTGSIVKYEAKAKSEYKNADAVAIASYSALFNTNPFFDSPDIIILDDAHASENYISSLWSLRVDRSNEAYKPLHEALSNLLKPQLNPANYSRLLGHIESIADATWADKLPTPEFEKIKDEFLGIVDAHVKNLDLRHPWSMLREHLDACHVYLSPNDILIRPLIPPTWAHTPFENAKQRVYMSATLGSGGDLERLTGRSNIKRLPIPDGWDRQGIGRRFFLFPEMSLKEDEVSALGDSLMKVAGRSVALVPSDRSARALRQHITDTLSFRAFSAEDIEESKKPFLAESKAVAIIANRYDGIDFPGDDCRLLFVHGLPKATNSQERFLMYRMGAYILFNERIQTRVLQATGRCTRSSEDYSAVVVTGEELTDYLLSPKRQSYLHPELQAELKYGIEQSKASKRSDFVDFLKIFLDNGAEWEEANSDIVALRDSMVEENLPGIEELGKVVEFEVQYQKRMWQGDWEEALKQCEIVLSIIKHPDLRGYRAIWNYLAGSAAWLNENSSKAREHFKVAKETAPGIPWLVLLSKYQLEETQTAPENTHLWKQIERVEMMLSNLGMSHSRKYDNFEKEIIEGLGGKGSFEHAHRLLGELLGFESKKVETDASPDPWWVVDDICFVFEDHAGATSDVLDATKARQVATHPNWIREHAELNDGTSVVPVLVSPVTKAKDGAAPHLQGVLFWPIEDFKTWAKDALSVIRELRRKFIEPGDLAWRAEAAESFEKNMLTAPSILKFLEPKVAAKVLEIVK